VSQQSCPVVHMVGRHAAVKAALHSPDLTVEHPFRASRLTMGPTILDLDGDKHVTGKRLLSRLFTPERIADYRDRLIAPVVQRTWDRLAGHGAVDVVAEVATPIPPMVVFGMLGLPPDDAPAAYWKMMQPIAAFIGDNRTGYGDALRAHRDLVAFLDYELARGVASQPRLLDEVIASSRAEGATMSEAIASVILLMLAGTETTICGLANVFHAIGEYPHSWQQVLDGGLTERAFVEEVLRVEAPVHHTHRFAVADTAVIAELPLMRGTVVEVCLRDANHTDERIMDADRWEPGEGRGTGATFGLGRHACIGKGLAICEMVELAATLKRAGFAPTHILERDPIEGVTFRRPARVIALR
jgi:cytochrome P450